MDISHIEHVGIAVTSLDEAIPFYENMLGFKCFAIEEVADQKVRTAFFKVGQTKIELLEATAPDSAIAKFIANNGGASREQIAGSAFVFYHQNFSNTGNHIRTLLVVKSDCC